MKELKLFFMNDFLSFLDNNPTPYHFVEYAKKALIEAGFVEYHDYIPSKIEKGKGFLVTQLTGIVAFDIRGKDRCIITATHSDSPCLKLKPNYDYKVDNMSMIRFSTYGDGIWHTFIDRSLRAAGLLFLKAENGKITKQIYDSHKGVAIIPALAIHYESNRKLSPVFDAQNHLNGFVGKDSFTRGLCKELNCTESDLFEQDIRFIDSTPSNCINGFITSSRLEGLSSSYVSLIAFIDSSQKAQSEDDGITRMFCVFDRECVGNDSVTGAASQMLPNALQSIFGDSLISIKDHSLILSINADHAKHPLYSQSTQYSAQMGDGICVKLSSRNHYATDPISICFIERISGLCGVPYKITYPSNQIDPGTSFGPVLSTLTGIRTVDIGGPIWGKNSSRETMRWSDIDNLIGFIRESFIHFKSYHKY